MKESQQRQKKLKRKKHNLLDNIFLFGEENCKSEEVAEEAKLDYGVTVEEKKKTLKRHATAKAQYKMRSIALDTTCLALSCSHIITNISDTN